jgi:hypothetical protein
MNLDLSPRQICMFHSSHNGVDQSALCNTPCRTAGQDGPRCLAPNYRSHVGGSMAVCQNAHLCVGASWLSCMEDMHAQDRGFVS